MAQPYSSIIMQKSRPIFKSQSQKECCKGDENEWPERQEDSQGCGIVEANNRCFKQCKWLRVSEAENRIS